MKETRVDRLAQCTLAIVIATTMSAAVRAGEPAAEVARDAKAAATASEKEPFDWQQAKQFWSFVPPTRHAAPPVKRAEWVREPIDAFILAKLEAAGLKPSAPADRRTLIRRVTFDLTGLPPTPEAVAAFVHDESSDAYEQLVDRLLASPPYGEHWARFWLDIMRYAEDQAHIVGNDKSLTYPNAYLYRDWVIAALNSDMGYDRFIKLQLAADLMEPDDDHNRAALGFIGLGPKYYSRKSLEVMADEWEDRIDTLSRGLLGLTVACARCHDHKYDPVSMRDYYALAGVFAGTEMFNRPLDGKRELGKEGETKNPEDALHIVREGKPTDLNVFIRGDVKNKGATVQRRFLRVLSTGEPSPFTQGSGRLELADAIVDPSNPLTARVLVNRVWLRYFGSAIVSTPSNFGKLGERPTHPELLDDLAVRFMEHGWSLKWLHREIVLSATYRQGSHVAPEGKAADGANRLLGHMNRRRLDVESWRDAVLSAAGRLDTAVGGPSIEPNDAEATRRTVYARVSRLELNAMLAMFDFPDPNAHSERRIRTTTPLQGLFVLNSAFMVRQAEALSQRLATEAGDDDAARIRRAYELLFARAPSDREAGLAIQFLSAESGDRAGQWVQYAQALLVSNEMRYLD